MFVKYELYTNDFLRRNQEILVFSLKELENRIFEKIEFDYTKKENRHKIFFPTECPSTIVIDPAITHPLIWIHQIEDVKGIIFSDGTYTAGQKHWSKEVKEWLKHCKNRIENPKFNFVD